MSYRARLVAQGFLQKEEIDYVKTFAPVVRFSTFKLLIALTVQLKLNISHLDVKTAFINGILEENVYMRQPEGFVIEDFKNKVYKLGKAVFVLKQSSQQQYKPVDDVLLKLDCLKLKYKPCLYTKKENNLLTMVTLYIDDFFMFSNDQKITQCLKQNLSSTFRIKDLGKAKSCSGVKVRYDHDNNSILLDQQVYLEHIRKRFKMKNCKSVSTPLDKCKVHWYSNAILDDTKIPHRRLRSLMYLAVLTRPDIAFVYFFTVSFVCQFMICYTKNHFKYARRVLRFL